MNGLSVTVVTAATRRGMRAALLLGLMSAPLFAQSAQMQPAAENMASRVTAAKRKTVAIVDFTDAEGRATCLGRFLAEEFSAALANVATGFDVIERTQLKVILEEQKLSTTGLIDPATTRRLGKIAGADTVVSGTLTPFGDTIRVLIRAFDSERASLVASAAVDVPRTKAIDDLLNCGAQGQRPQTSSSQGTSKPQTVVQRGVSYSIQRCLIRSSTLMCELTIAHTLDADQDVKVGAARMVDARGNPITAERIESGSQTVRGDNWLRYTAVAGIPGTLRIWFDRAPEGRVPLLEIESNRTTRDGLFMGYQDYRIQFRNVEVVNGDGRN